VDNLQVNVEVGLVEPFARVRERKITDHRQRHFLDVLPTAGLHHAEQRRSQHGVGRCAHALGPILKRQRKLALPGAILQSVEALADDAWQLRSRHGSALRSSGSRTRQRTVEGVATLSPRYVVHLKCFTFSGRFDAGDHPIPFSIAQKNRVQEAFLLSRARVY
jgi:hypothetical protein